jgi:N-methylhydantoinase A
VTGRSFAVDVGGTFTDLIVESDGELRMFKALTTPEDPVVGVLDALSLAATAFGEGIEELLGSGVILVHATTRAINALVTETAARTAFLTTAGHPDILLFREGGRAEPFNFGTPYPEPLVPRSLTFEVPGRVLADGTIDEPLDEPRVVQIAAALREEAVEAVGVSLLWSIIQPAHELRVGELLELHLPGVPVTLSHLLNPTLREYRRASSTCIDASLKPLMADYLGSLQSRLEDAGFDGRLLIATSQGGMLDAAEMARRPIHSINSGPSMAPVAGGHFAQLEHGHATAIVADTGGTTFDVSVVREGVIPRTQETWIGPQYQGHITGFPSVDVTSVGAGGGSVAWVDSGGLLRVGPRSAGSVPGPACYGRGGAEPTVTDAALLLGYIDPGSFLGGAMRLDADSAHVTIQEQVAAPLGLGTDEAAAAVMRIATENMVHAIEEITVGQGIDARDAVVVGGGGAAGLNLVAIARRLGCSEVLIPEVGAALSAGGALLSDLSTEFRETLVTETSHFDTEGAEAVLRRLDGLCRDFAGRLAPGSPSRVEYAMEARYPRQNWEIEVPLPIDLGKPLDTGLIADAFHRSHERLFAISEPASPVVVVGWRARVSVALQDRNGARVAAGDGTGAEAGSRRVWFPEAGWRETPVVDFERLPDGESFAGPAIVESSFTSVVVEPEVAGRRTENGSLALNLKAAL